MRRELSSLLDSVSVGRSRKQGASARRNGPRRRGGSRRPVGLGVESLEGRALLATFTVTLNTDTGALVPGELRWAINTANATPGADVIDFNIAPGGAQAIALNPGLGVLPAITDQVTIDGTTQPGYVATPLITVSGAALAAGSDGIDFAVGSSLSTMQALELANFSRYGTVFTGGANLTLAINTFTSNLDGVHAAVAPAAGSVITGNLFQANTDDGIDLTDAGAVSIVSNIVTSSGGDGISLTEVAVPFIGSGVLSNQVSGSGASGLRMSAVTGTQVGGVGFGNTFNGNTLDGVRLLAGDYTGTVIDSNTMDANTAYGVHATGPVTGLDIIGNTIGSPGNSNLNGIGLTAGDYQGASTSTRILGNLIQDNFADGVTLLAGGAQNLILGTAANPNTIQINGSDGIQLASGNYTGTLIDSNIIRQNSVYGIHATGGAAAVTVVANAVGGVGAGNSSGIGLAAGDYDLGFGKAVFAGNTITDNTVDGVRMLAGGVKNLILGTNLLPNTIDSNGDDGIQLAAGDYTGTVIDSNLVRDNVAYGLQTTGVVTSADIIANTFGAAGVPNANGIGLIGGDYTGAFTATQIRGNTIADNTGDGVLFLGAARNLVVGTAALPNTIRDNGSDGLELPAGSYTGTLIDSNAIDGNTAFGINLTGAATGLTVTGNTIGTAALPNADGIGLAGGSYTGTQILSNTIDANTGDGIVAAGAVQNLVIGSAGNGNTIENNGSDGIELPGGSSTGTVINSNIIRGNTAFGINLTGAATSLSIVNNTIGQPGPGNANADGIGLAGGSYTGTQILSNTIASNTADGIVAAGAVLNLTIGSAGNANTIENNGSDGIELPGGSYTGTAIDSNTIRGNTAFGINLTGAVTSLAITGNTIGQPGPGNANADGIGLSGGSHTGTQILSNTIASNIGDGIVAAGAVQNLTIGSAGNANTIENNGSDGIELPGGTYTSTAIDSNIIRGNTAYGINLTGAATGLTVTGNTIGTAALPNADGIGLAGGSYTGTQILSNTIDANTGDGIVAAGAVQNLVIGSAGNGNTIENNGSDGIELPGGSSTGTVINSNIIRGNTAFGINLTGAATSLSIVNNTIGQPGPGNANADGIGLAGGSYTGTQILSNTIASNTADGIVAAGAVLNLTIGSAGNANTIENNGSDGIELVAGNHAGTAIDSNIIRGNAAYGILTGGGTPGLQVLSNTIGALGLPNGTGIGLGAGDSTGAQILGNTIERNTFDGILTLGGVQNLVIGTLASPNTVQDNGSNGIEFSPGNYAGTVVQANTVATNGDIGIAIDAGTNLTVGVPGAGNTVTGNTNVGIGARGTQTGTRIRSNTVTTNPIGIGLDAATGLAVGGTAAGEGNTITGSTSYGLGAQGTSTGTTVYGNTMTANAMGVGLSGAAGITIGGPAAGQANTIDANLGIGLGATGTLTAATVRGNSLQNNTTDGVYLLAAQGLTVGGTAAGESNTIDSNGSDGLEATGDSTGTTVLGNEIRFNTVHGVNLAAATNLTIGGTVLGSSNTIQSNGSAGVFATGTSTGSLLVGNLIDANTVGVDLQAAQGLTVNGGGAAASNTISGNTTAGVRASGDNVGTAVRGNLITGSPTGVLLADARNLTVGSTVAGDENRINANTTGVASSGNASGTVVLGNLIEGNNTGAALSGTTNLTIGGDATTGAGNLFDGNAIGVTATGTLTGTRVIGNTIVDGLTGVSLSNAVNLAIGDTGTGEGNAIENQALEGIKAGGVLNGTTIRQNTIDTSDTGILLDSATNLTVGGTGANEGNMVDLNTVGLDAFGTLTGTLVQGNSFVTNQTGIVLQDLVGPGVITNLTFGGATAAAGNLVSGNTQTGLFAEGDLSGTTIRQNTISLNGNGVGLFSARNLAFGSLAQGNTVADNLSAGIYATGNLTGTSILANAIDRNVAGGVIQNATNLAFGLLGSGNSLDDNASTGIWAGGTLTGTSVQDNLIDGLGVGIGSSTGIGLDNATGIRIGGAVAGEGNTVVNQSSSGLFATGSLAGTLVRGNSFDDGKLGMTLVSVTNGTIGGTAAGVGNTVERNTDAGLYAAGDSTGTTVRGNGFTDNTTHVLLVNATNLTFGGTAAGAGNATSGGGTGLYATGTLTGTTASGNQIVSGGTAVGLFSATGFALGSSLPGGGNFIAGVTSGVYATGPLAGTSLRANVIRSTGAGSAAVGLDSATGLLLGDIGGGNDIQSTGSGGVGIFATGGLTGTEVRSNLLDASATGVVLAAAQGVTFGGVGLGNTISNSLDVGLRASGACTGSFVLETNWVGNPVNVQSTATGLTISPPAP